MTTSFSELVTLREKGQIQEALIGFETLADESLESSDFLIYIKVSQQLYICYSTLISQSDDENEKKDLSAEALELAASAHEVARNLDQEIFAKSKVQLAVALLTDSQYHNEDAKNGQVLTAMDYLNEALGMFRW